ncbi:acetate uptake transporter [Marinifilum fragile]|uniref:acetate uptake transporter n=1 Tax=Marinifilum fragile TaxID=570161 RepID=UPI0006D0DA47|nr:GPR1/FUN34/YaaH family transporter [Marinifilum fragile]
MNNVNLGNPAVVGLGGFGLSTLLLQFHNLGLCGLGPVLAVGFAFGGIAQLCAGLLEHKNGNNFGFAAFSAYGAFWISIGIVWVLNHFGIYKSSGTDVGFFLLAYTFFTMILWIASLFIHGAMATTFSILLLGFILLDLGHFGFPAMNTAAAYVLIVCALAAWYMMAAIIINGVAGRNILGVGEAWLKAGEKELSTATK